MAADGSSLPNNGEKAVRILMEEGHRCLLNMEVTDAQKPLMSVSPICDAGNTVTFREVGGSIVHLATGQETRLHLMGNVYRLTVRVYESGSRFSRQGH